MEEKQRGKMHPRDFINHSHSGSCPEHRSSGVKRRSCWLFVDCRAGPTKVVEWRAGDSAGMLPYSRFVTPPRDSSALEPLEIFAIPRPYEEHDARVF
jgi:hypothetical protein